MRAWLLAGVIAVGGVSAGALGDVITIGAEKDNTLFEDPTGTLSNGAGTAMFVGNTTRGFGVRRGLLAFKVQQYLPAGAVITRAEMTLFCDRTHSGSISMGLYAMQASWGEGASFTGLGGGVQAERGDATWTTRFYGIGPEWTRPGGDFASTASALLSVAGQGRSYTWSGAGLVADVQRWLDNPDVNNGWVLKAVNESPSGTAKRFVTREGDVVSQQPRLRIEYTVVPTPASLAVLALGAAAGVAGGRRRRV